MGNCLYDCMTKKRNNQNFEACHIEFFLFAYFCELWMNLLNAKSVLLGVTSLWWFLLDKDDWSHKNKHSLYKILQPSSKSCFNSKTYTTLFLLLFPCICSWKKSLLFAVHLHYPPQWQETETKCTLYINISEQMLLHIMIRNCNSTDNSNLT